MRLRHAGPILAAFLALIALAGQTHAGDMRIMAAASLQPALAAFIDAQDGTINGDRIVPVYASSGTLARQIAHGAPADLFISANPRWADWLATELAVNPNTVSDLLKNRLVLVTASGAAKTSLKELSKSGRLMLGDPAHVPAGQYAKQTIQALGLWETLLPQLVFGSNVRTAVAFAERGEVDAALVYRSDAIWSDGLVIVEEFDSSLHDPIVYRAVVLTEKAEPLLTALQSKDAAAMFERYGFEPALAGR